MVAQGATGWIESSAASISVAAPVEVAPLPPQNVVATRAVAHLKGATISWAAPSAGTVSKYTTELRADGGAWGNLVDHLAATLTYTYSDVPGVSWEARLTVTFDDNKMSAVIVSVPNQAALGGWTYEGRKRNNVVLPNEMARRFLPNLADVNLYGVRQAPKSGAAGRVDLKYGDEVLSRTYGATDDEVAWAGGAGVDIGPNLRFTAQDVPGADFIAAEPVSISTEARAAPCLLYTSPSPRDRQKSRMPSSA